MEKEIYYDKERVKQILCFSSAPQSIAVTEDAVNYLLENNNEISLITSSGQKLEEVVSDLSNEINTHSTPRKVIVLVRTSVRYSLVASDLVHLSKIITSFPAEAEVCWGMATSEEQENNVTLIIAISSKC